GAAAPSTSPLPFRGGVGGGVSRRWQKFSIPAILLLTPVLFHFAKQVRFDSDMNRLNYMTPELKAAQDKINRLNAMALQSVYVVSEGATLEEALRANERLTPKLDSLKREGLVRKYSGVSAFLMSDSLQRARIRRWENYWTPEKKQQLLETLKQEGKGLKYKASAFDGFRALLDKKFEPTPEEAVERFKRQFLSDYITEQPGKVSVITMLKSGPEHREQVYDRLTDDRLTDRRYILDKQYLTRQFVGMVQEDFNNIALYSSLLVFLALLLVHGRIELAVITFLPMLFSWIWILGLMALLGLEFNIVNVILSALIFGLGDDFAIFVMDGLQQKYKTGQRTLPVIRTSILISAAATIIGLGVLIFAKHPAVQSLALVSVVGIFCVVLMSQTLEPFLFNLLIQNRVDNRRPPWTLFKIAKSAFAFGYFIFGSLLLTALGFLFVRWLPVGKRRVKYAYHWTLSKFTGSLIYIMANVKKRIINPAGEDFSKPAVIICNHQSVLDILSTTMLHPKLLLLTNKWVWESPVFGQVVRMADYYPVGEGVDNVERLRERVAEGFSIVVFPEGTRSPDGAIKRFHKGAFFLAEQFNIEILPLVIHGTGYAMTKGDFMLKDGQITLKFLPRIAPDDTRYGANYTERAKLIGRYFRQEHAALQAEIETPAYHREKLISNYLYKGPVLEWYMRIKTALENNYVLFDELLPKTGKILDIGCGYGFMDYMLHFRAPGRDITGMDYDAEKIAVANHCYSKTENMRFVHGDILHYPVEPHDAFVLADVLHYLQPEEQTQVLRRCLANLNPGGVIVIRDGNKDLESRQKGTWWTEFFSTRLLKFNKTSEQGLSFLSAKTVQAVVAEFGLQCEVIDPSRYTSNVIFVIRAHS
ncbi:MAG: 1-acyl-sn-glycerol-3-phosphate acyltransferase, partial [Thermoanaerobaculia bacterium]|nr:1-acyl-sn-glycerol-3-phosphate acyltransferase [Thermoanaerobaculia bacterium]